jgi:hypothetical protein
VRDHLHDDGDPASLLADEPPRGAVELHLGGGVGVVAELVLEALETERVALPSGSHRGTRKQEGVASSPPIFASVRKASLIGAEQNHLWPVSRYSPPGPPPSTGTAVDRLARTSEPPCFSVIAIPNSAPRLPEAWTNPGS